MPTMKNKNSVEWNIPFTSQFGYCVSVLEVSRLVLVSRPVSRPVCLVLVSVSNPSGLGLDLGPQTFWSLIFRPRPATKITILHMSDLYFSSSGKCVHGEIKKYFFPFMNFSQSFVQLVALLYILTRILR